MSLKPGTKLGPYEILSQLGAGGMGEVYKARDTRLDRIVSLKTLRHIWLASKIKKRFQREARTVAGLNHPHICMLYDFGRQDATNYLVMQGSHNEAFSRRRFDSFE